MPKFTTIFRTIVMVFAAVIAVEGWQRYGPSQAHLKSLATRALEIAHDALNKPELMPEVTAGLVPGPPGVADTFSTAPQPEAIVAPSGDALELPVAPEIFAPTAPAQSIVAPSRERPQSATDDKDRLPALMSRLDELGGIEPQLVSWGSGGQLYRFCCQAAVDGAPNLKRHFEAVAAEKAAAVEQVVAKVEAWRAAQQDRSDLR
jgi:hypothetical protein